MTEDGTVDLSTTPFADLPGIINQSVERMMDDARRFLAELDLSLVPAGKIDAALRELEPQVRLAETQRLRAAWLSLHESRMRAQ